MIVAAENTATEDAVVRLHEINTKLRLELTQLRARRTGSYRLRQIDVIHIGMAWREVNDGEIEYGLRRLEAILEELEPRWREMT